MTSALRVAVVGVGHLGRQHARILKSLGGVELVALVDVHRARAEEIGRELGVPVAGGHREVLDRVDAVTIAVPTRGHREVARDFLERRIPTFVEKPLAHTIEEAEELAALSRKTGTPLQVGHVERFNPAVQAVLGRIRKPRFIEAHRLSPFRFRSADIDVVMDLMIHDLDLALHLAASPLARVDAVGVSLLFGAEDIANARLEFEDGCVANLTSSRISDKSLRKIRIFTEDHYASIDTLEKSVRLYRTTPQLAETLARFPKDREPSLADLAAIPREFYSIEDLSLPDEEPLANELKAFIECARARSEPVVPAEHGVRAMRAAQRVMEEIRGHRWG
ncbi:MAG: Gfo/Idh/MocA family oxidoreductase [Planctomycetes bacterium]|nr:Gfo/Idh/MocA family oxidoreductase [Planctomycetota bacterium]